MLFGRIFRLVVITWLIIQTLFLKVTMIMLRQMMISLAMIVLSVCIPLCVVFEMPGMLIISTLLFWLLLLIGSIQSHNKHRH